MIVAAILSGLWFLVRIGGKNGLLRSEGDKFLPLTNRQAESLKEKIKNRKQ